MRKTAALAELDRLIAEVRGAARELVRQGMTSADVARANGLSEATVRDLVSDAPTLSASTRRELLEKASRRA